jgi:hypothetical protein
MDHQAFAQLLGNYGEFAGAIGVIATLIYLSIQVRQNTLTIQRSDEAHRKDIDMATNSRFNEQRRVIYTDAELARIFRTGLFEPMALDEVEWMRFSLYVQQMLINAGEQYRVSDTLLVEREASLDGFLTDFFKYPGARAAWHAGANYDPDWEARVQDIFDRTQALTGDELATYEFPWLGFGDRSKA